MIDAQGPDLEVGKDAVDPGQDDMGSHRSDDMGIVGDAGGAWIAGPTVGLGGGAGREVGGEEGMQAGSRIIGHLGQADAARAGAVLHLDGADNEHLALVAAATAAGHRIVFAATGDFSFVDLDEAGEQASAGGKHAAPQLAQISQAVL